MKRGYVFDTGRFRDKTEEAEAEIINPFPSGERPDGPDPDRQRLRTTGN